MPLHGHRLPPGLERRAAVRPARGNGELPFACAAKVCERQRPISLPT